MSMDGLLRAACKWSPAAWFDGYAMIERKNGDLVRPTANVYQLRISAILEYAHEAGRPARLVCLKPRQKGSSTFSVASLYRRMQAKRGRGLIAGGAHFQGANLFKILKTYARNDGLDPKTCEVMETEARLKNGGTIERITLANPNAGRSGTYQAMVITEVAYLSEEGVANATNVLNGLLKCVPYEADTFIIQESTAKGATGDFFETYSKGITFEEFKAGKNGYVKVFAAWYEFDDSRLPAESEGITSEDDLTAQEREYAEKYKLDLDQVAWMRWAVREECRGDFDRFLQDYPFDDESCFLRSGRGRFNSTALKYQEDRAKVQHPEYGVLEHDARTDRVSFRPTSEAEARVVCFERPKVGLRYLVSCDPATGDSQTSGVDPDSNSYGVLRAGYLEHGRWVEPALAMRNICYADGPRFGNWWDTDIVEEELYRMARYYGGCKIAVEVNKDRGLIELLKLRYDVDLYLREMFNRREQVTTQAYGWLTDQRTREMVISTMAAALREAGKGKMGEGFEVRCPWAVAQMKNFVTRANGRSEAASGKHDDDVLMLSIGLQLIDQGTPFYIAEREEWLPRDLRQSHQAQQLGRAQYR
jgi:hypothetical protein